MRPCWPTGRFGIGGLFRPQLSKLNLGGLLDFLDLFCFHFRSPVRGFGSLTWREPKTARLQKSGRERNESAEGNRRDWSRVARRYASGWRNCSVRVGFEAEKSAVMGTAVSQINHEKSLRRVEGVL
jgi:hypothetical protein